MSVCSHLCQHPACWKAEIEFQRRRQVLRLLQEGRISRGQLQQAGVTDDFLRTLCGREEGGEEASTTAKVTATAREVDKEDRLPQLHLLNLMQGQFEDDQITSNQESYDISSSRNLPLRKTMSAGASSIKMTVPANSIAASIAGTIRSKKSKKTSASSQQPNGGPGSSGKGLGTSSTLANAEQLPAGVADQFERVLVWVPGKKKRKKKRKVKSANEVSFKMFDGNELPEKQVSSTRERSPRRQAGMSIQRPRNLPPLDIESMDASRFLELMEHQTTTKSALLYSRDTIDRGPMDNWSPLKTTRIGPQKPPTDELSERVAQDPTLIAQDPTSIAQDPTSIAQDTASTAPVKKAKVIERYWSEVALDTPGKESSSSDEEEETTRGRRRLRDDPFKPRQELPLTRISVPKKIIRQYPYYDHCVSSIKKAEFPDVAMQPLSGSEQTSIAPSEMSVRSDDLAIELSNENPDARYDLDPILVPAPSPTSLGDPSQSRSIINLAAGQNNKQVIQYTHSEEGFLPGKVECLSDDQIFRAERLSQRLENEAASEVGTEVAARTALKSRPSVSFNFPEHERVAGQRLETVSPAASLLSKPSSEADKEIIRQTYEQYKSLTPYRTPLPSSHKIDEETNSALQEEDNNLSTTKNNKQLLVGRRSTIGGSISPVPSGRERVLLPQSLMNLNEFLPNSSESLAPTSSFVKRSLSPSRSMSIRQPAQPGSDIVPAQLSIRSVPLKQSNRARTSGDVEYPLSYLSDRSVSAFPNSNLLGGTGRSHWNNLGKRNLSTVIPSISCTFMAVAPASSPDSDFMKANRSTPDDQERVKQVITVDSLQDRDETDIENQAQLIQGPPVNAASAVVDRLGDSSPGERLMSRPIIPSISCTHMIMDVSAESVACMSDSGNLHGLTVTSAPMNSNLEMTSEEAEEIDLIADGNSMVNFTAEDLMVEFTSPLPDPTSNLDDLESICSELANESNPVKAPTPVTATDQPTRNTEAIAVLPPSPAPLTSSAIKRMNGEQLVKARESAKQDKSSSKSSKLASIQDEEEEDEEDEEEVSEAGTETEVLRVKRSLKLEVAATNTAVSDVDVDVEMILTDDVQFAMSGTDLENGSANMTSAPFEVALEQSQLNTDNTDVTYVQHEELVESPPAQIVPHDSRASVDGVAESVAEPAESAESVAEPLVEPVEGSSPPVGTSVLQHHTSVLVVNEAVSVNSQSESVPGHASEETDCANIQRADVASIEYLSDNGAPRSSAPSLTDTDADTNCAASLSNSRSTSDLDAGDAANTLCGGSHEVLVEARPSSPYFTLPEGGVPDFSEGLNLNLDIDDEIARAMEGLERLSGRDDDDASSGFSISF